MLLAFCNNPSISIVSHHQLFHFTQCDLHCHHNHLLPQIRHTKQSIRIREQRYKSKGAIRNKATAGAHIPSNPNVRHEYNVSETVSGADACKKLNLTSLGIDGPTTLYHNLTFQELHEHEVANGEGEIAVTQYGKTFTVDTGKFTGRSPKDKWIVLNKGSESEANIDWGSVNQPTTPEVFDELYEKAVNYFSSKEKAYVFDCFCGANPKVRCICMNSVRREIKYTF